MEIDQALKNQESKHYDIDGNWQIPSMLKRQCHGHHELITHVLTKRGTHGSSQFVTIYAPIFQIFLSFKRSQKHRFPCKLYI